MSASINILARMGSAFDVAQRGTHYHLVHDLPRPSLAVSPNNRLRVRDVLHRPRLRRNLPRMPRLRHSLKGWSQRQREREEGQVFYQVFYETFYHAFQQVFREVFY